MSLGNAFISWLLIAQLTASENACQTYNTYYGNLWDGRV